MNTLLWLAGPAVLVGLLYSQTPAVSNAEVGRLFVEDQKDREGFARAGADRWREISARDVQRRQRIRQLLEAGQVRTGEDYQNAAMIFQHGDKPADYLLAHVLATTAMAKGRAESRWLAAATLDRYLTSLNQPQVFGTQYRKMDQSSPFTQAPYDKDLLPDSLRQEHCVPPHASQLRNLAALDKGEEMPFGGGCR